MFSCSATQRPLRQYYVNQYWHMIKYCDICRLKIHCNLGSNNSFLLGTGGSYSSNNEYCFLLWCSNVKSGISTYYSKFLQFSTTYEWDFMASYSTLLNWYCSCEKQWKVRIWPNNLISYWHQTCYTLNSILRGGNVKLSVLKNG